MEEKRLLIKQICNEIRLGVVITDLLMTLYVLQLIVTNTSSWVPGALLGFTPLGVVLLLRASSLFKFCWVHKLMLLHSCAVYICCLYQANYGFGTSLSYMRWIMFLTGAFLFIYLITTRNVCKWLH